MQPIVNMFLAILLGPILGPHIASVGHRMNAKLRLRGELETDDHLHVTLYDLSEQRGPQGRIIREASVAAEVAAAAWAPFEVRLTKWRAFRESREDIRLCCEAAATPGTTAR